MTMTITQQIITVAVVVLGTMTTRFLPFIIFPEGKEPLAVITYLGNKWKKSTLLSIGGGTVLYMVLVQTIFG